MTEHEWASCTAPYQMLEFLEQSGLSQRRFRLLSVAIVRSISTSFADPVLHEVLDIVEKAAGDVANESQMLTAEVTVRECLDRIRQTPTADETQT